MIKEKEIEEHYHEMTSEKLHVLKEEFQWLMANSILNTSEQIRFVNKTLSIRGDLSDDDVERKLLIMCTSCGHSRIMNVNVPDDKVKMMLFDEFMKPCEKCKTVNKYSWKFM